MAGRKRRKNRFQFLTKKFPVRMQRKLVLLFIAVILAFLVLVGRITYINVTKGSKYTKLVLIPKHLFNTLIVGSIYSSLSVITTTSRITL